jgi:hypothetical protein
MDVIMESVAETRDRLNRIWETGSGEGAASPKGSSRKCPHGRLYQKCDLCERDRKIECLDRLCRRQSAILTGIAVALRGEPEESVAWSHHDLAERVQTAVDELEVLREERTAQAERLVELEAQADRQVELETERSFPVETVAWGQGTRPNTGYIPNSQAQLLVLAERLERFRARVWSVANTRTGHRRSATTNATLDPESSVVAMRAEQRRPRSVPMGQLGSANPEVLAPTMGLFKVSPPVEP